MATTIHPGPDPHSVDGLQRSLNDLIKQADKLSKDVREAEAQRRKANAISAGIAALIAFFVLLIFIVAIQSRSTAKDAKASAKEAAIVSKYIADCTTPTGKCYRDGNKRTSGAVGNIFKGQVVIVECERLWPRDNAKFEECVGQRLQQLFAMPTPKPTP